MKCDLPIELLNAYLDGELDAQKKARVENHLRDCPACREELETLRKIDEQIRERVFEEPSREFVFSLNRRIVDTVRVPPRRSFFRYAPVFAPVAAALLTLVILSNVSPSKKIADISDRMVYQKLEPRQIQAVYIPEPKIMQGPSVAQRTVRDQREKVGMAKKAETRLTESANEADMDKLAVTAPQYEQVVRAIIDTTGTIIKVATGNTLIPEKDTMLEKQLSGQQVAPPMIAGRKVQVYMEVATEAQKEE